MTVHPTVVDTNIMVPVGKSRHYQNHLDTYSGNHLIPANQSNS